MDYLLRGGLLVTMNAKREVFQGDLLISNGKIKSLSRANGSAAPNAKAEIIDAHGKFVLPGLIQAHTHLVQALFRGYADDMALLDWLRTRIWPLEFHHNDSSIRASARIALLEMQKLGTTSILDMGTVRHTQPLLESVSESGMRYWGGKCLMDLKKSSGPLFEDFDSSIKESVDLLKEWKEKSELIKYVLCPRFAISCTEKMLRACVDLQEEWKTWIHTHASESKEEVEIIKKRTGLRNVEYFNHIGMLNQRTAIVHGIHLSKKEIRMMRESKAGLVHCPSSNLKLASGIAPIETYLDEGITVAVGSDGAPCNNTMDPFYEMRLMALLQKPQFGPKALPAEKALEIMTLGGAQLLGCEDTLGSLEVGKQADVIVVDRSHPSVATVENPYSSLVYSCSGRDVTDVLINGKCVVRNREHQIWDQQKVIADAKQERDRILRLI